MKKRMLFLIIPVITLILEILPYGAVLNFGRPASDGSIGYIRESYSYFDLMPFGYANFSPFVTAMLTCLILVLLLIYCITGNIKLAVKIRNIICICAVFSLCPLLLGVKFYSAVGMMITISLIMEIIFLHLAVKSSEK